MPLNAVSSSAAFVEPVVRHQVRRVALQEAVGGREPEAGEGGEEDEKYRYSVCLQSPYPVGDHAVRTMVRETCLRK